METHSLEATARRMSRHRARGELRRAWLCAVELTVAEPQRGRWWAQRGDLAAALRDEDEVLLAMRQAVYLFRREGAPERADSVAMWLQRNGFDAGDVARSRRRAWRRAG